MKVNFDSPYKLDDGYGNAGENILLALDRHPNVSVYTDKNWGHTSSEREGLCKRTVELYNRKFSNDADFSIRFSQPTSFSNAPNCKKKKIGFSMWEFTDMPKPWVSGANSVPISFVPCTHNKELWERGGVKVPVYVVPLGVDKNVFYHRPDGTFQCPDAVGRQQRGYSKFTFMIAGTMASRKNPEMVYTVFNELFKDKDDVRLIMKSPARLALTYKPTHNVAVINATWWRVRYADLLREGDCFLYPTCGEGFGLCPVEAMAVGNTVICTDWSGPADYLDDSYAYKLNYSLSGSTGSEWGQTLGFAVPDRAHLKELMWHVYTHQEEAREKGRLAAQAMAANFTWDHTVSRINNILLEHL